MKKRKKNHNSNFVNFYPFTIKKCSNCGKNIPKASTHCYLCGAEQIIGIAQDAFEYESPKLSSTQIPQNKMNINKLKCVRCESSENLVYYTFTKNSKVEIEIHTIKQVYKSKFTHEFPTCRQCEKIFKRWYIKYLFFLIVLGGYGIIMILIINALINSFQINNPSWWEHGWWDFFSSPEFIILVIFVSISAIACYAIYFKVQTNKTNPEQFIRILSYFYSLHRSFKHTPQVRPPSLKE